MHVATRISAVLGAIVALVVLGPVAVAVVLLRCCGGASGPTAGAYVVVAIVVLVAMALSAAVAGWIASRVRRLVG